MISKIDITNFGLFNNYSWNTIIGKDKTFKKLNIIYGRNYSGKTTLARIFKCIEDANLHKNYTDCGFTITFNDGKTITESEFETAFKVRVYNTDFVKDNLSWLHNDDGTIKPFTILGAKNVELDKQIKNIEIKLGNEEEKTGLFYELSVNLKILTDHKGEHQTKNNSLEEKLRKRANDKIKVDSTLFLPSASKKTYTINDIKNDVLSIENDLSKHSLDAENIAERLKLMKEVSMDNINFLPESQPNFATYYLKTKELLIKKIKPNQPIADLVNDSLLQEWVRQGIDKHKEKRTECGFCGNPIDKNLWDKLDAHFSKESEELRKELKSQIDTLEQAKQSLSVFLILNKDLFYTSLSLKFESILKGWNSAIKTYGKSIDKLISELKEREKDIFREKELSEVSDVSVTIFEAIKEFNALIGEHNNKTSSLSTDQIKARLELRKANIAQYLIDIDYKNESEKIQELEKIYKKAEADLIPKQEEIVKLTEEKRTLEAQAKDESKGAELVNQHLTHFFGHNELKLVAEGQTPNMKFKIDRDGIDANNLSEGECSLISFCYFVAKMEDELKDEINANKLLIYIDDPISSLDSNHIFFMFSLIESIIAKPKKYGQLFISTHNLDFLKYLKKLTIPKYKPQPNSGDKGDVKYFMIERKNKGNTTLKLAPDYLKNYITEFNYLFNQVYQCSISDASTISHDYQYNFGNNMRKFLEAYLFYKYPSHKLSNDERIKKYFNNDSITINLVNRVINEYSHIGEHFDRSMEPVDIDEINKISNAVINKIKISDPDQYEALLESIQ
ncbi:MAG: AAA family ATPase [Bacteroidia bacterium]|nr:AAA family ATPase [Bacteroidia bacterium]